MTTRTTMVQQQIAIIENQTNTNNVKSSQMASDSLISHLISPQDGTQRFGIYSKSHGPSNTNPSTPAVDVGNPMMQPRNRFGMILTQQSGQIDEVHLKNLSAVTPTSHKDNKQGSPFYAVPADALNEANIVKRPPKAVAVPLSQRFSEPPKGPIVGLRHLRNQNGSGDENEKLLEKSHLSGSLDELKRRNRQARGRLDPWPLDSSWEFMGQENEENEELDDDLNTKPPQVKNKNYGGVKPIHIRNGIPIIDAVPKRPMTVNQIIAKKLPDLNVLELAPKVEEPSSRFGTMKSKRTSAYDNLDRGNSGTYGYAGSIVHPDGSVNSDDGTVFSEPWDSSRWDTMLNSTDELSETIHFSKCKPACLSGDDDTLVEDNSLVVLRNKPPVPSNGKVATIGRSRSIRDREVLSE